MDKLLSMSKREIGRLEVLQRLAEKRMKQRAAAEQLGVSVRHVKRLLRNYRQAGAAGLVSKRRGRPSNNQLSSEVRKLAVELVRARYPVQPPGLGADFGPTLAHEKLTEAHGLKLSRESVRQLLVAAGLWRPRRAKRARVHQMRPRRACLGELVQIDGSPYDWFEGRAPACSLLVFIDDASGRLLELYFTPQESFFSYCAAVQRYLTRHGKPRAFYSDKHSIFRVNAKNAVSGTGLTQFGRAMQELDIQIICANTPQAKGRVERANQTLQDRLVKELRLLGISDRARANAYAPQFIADFNRRFAVLPNDPADTHRPLLPGDNLDHILSWQETRTLSKNLTLQFKKIVYRLRRCPGRHHHPPQRALTPVQHLGQLHFKKVGQMWNKVQTERASYALRNAKVTVCEDAQGAITIRRKGRLLQYSTFLKHKPKLTINPMKSRQAEVVSSKSIDHKLKQPTRPADNHPPSGLTTSAIWKPGKTSARL